MKPKPITRNAAIRVARYFVGPLWLYDGRWRFNHFKATHAKESAPNTFRGASRERAQILINEACQFLGAIPPAYKGGKWTSYVPKPAIQ